MAGYNPKFKQAPSEKTVKAVNPQNNDAQSIAWQLSSVDKMCELWGWDHLVKTDFDKIFSCLEKLETMTWSDIKANGNNHTLEKARFSKKAQDRLEELKLDDLEYIFSIRLNSTCRIYGVRDGRVFKILWHDPHHKYDCKDSAYPVSLQDR